MSVQTLNGFTVRSGYEMTHHTKGKETTWFGRHMTLFPEDIVRLKGLGVYEINIDDVELLSSLLNKPCMNDCLFSSLCWSLSYDVCSHIHICVNIVAVKKKSETYQPLPKVAKSDKNRGTPVELGKLQCNSCLIYFMLGDRASEYFVPARFLDDMKIKNDAVDVRFPTLDDLLNHLRENQEDLDAIGLCIFSFPV